jgi:hypothetical protein
MSNKHYYAAYNGYGTSFTYDSDGWTVHAFTSQAERDKWVNADDYPNGNPTRENVTAETAYKIAPDLRTQPVSSRLHRVVLHN